MELLRRAVLRSGGTILTPDPSFKIESVFLMLCIDMGMKSMQHFSRISYSSLKNVVFDHFVL